MVLPAGGGAGGPASSVPQPASGTAAATAPSSRTQECTDIAIFLPQAVHRRPLPGPVALEF